MEALITQVIAEIDSQLNSPELPWLIFGVFGQAFFFARFFWQWMHSERVGRSVIPPAFWYFSLGGGVSLMIYAIHRNEPVFILGQAFGLLVYLRNLQFLFRERS